MSASFYLPNKEIGQKSEWIIFNELKKPHYYYLVVGSQDLGGSEAARFVARKLEAYIEAEKNLIFSCEENPTAGSIDMLQTHIYSIIHRIDDELTEYLGEPKRNFGHASATLELVVFCGSYAFVVHVGHNRTAYLSKGCIMFLTKVHSRYESRIQELKKSGNLKGIADLDKRYMDQASSRLGKGTISKLSIQPILLDPDGFFLTVTHKFDQAYGLEIGPLKGELFNDFSNEDPAVISKSLYQKANARKSDRSIGVFVTKVPSASKESAGLLNQKLEAIRKLEYFSDIRNNTNYLHAICSICEIQDFQKGAFLIEEGKPAEKFFILISGAASVTHQKNEVITVVGGEPIGEASVECEEKYYFSTAQADVNLKALVIKKNHLESLRDKYPEIEFAIHKANARMLSKKIFSLATDLVIIKNQISNIANKHPK